MGHVTPGGCWIRATCMEVPEGTKGPRGIPARFLIASGDETLSSFEAAPFIQQFSYAGVQASDLGVPCPSFSLSTQYCPYTFCTAQKGQQCPKRSLQK